MEKRTKKWLKVVLQLIIAGFAIYFVVQQIDLDAFLNLLTGANIGWLLLAFVFYNASKILSAFRLNYFFRALGLNLSEKFNLQLYYLGMLYNQFLPGGIGGDGYKVYLLNKRYKATVKLLLAATLLDRISGVVALGFLLCILALLGTLDSVIGNWIFLFWGGIILAYPLYQILVNKVFPTFKKVNTITNLQALGVQTLQLVCAYCILLALGVENGYIDYLTLFLITSVAAALPISLPGGIGVREAIFALAYTYFGIEQTSAVALASLFFLISLLSALGGIPFVKLKEE